MLDRILVHAYDRTRTGIGVHSSEQERSLVRENALKLKLRRGEVAIGLFAISPYPAMVEVAGLAGFDFCILDMEHGSLDALAAEDLCRAADAVGLTSIVRVRKNDGPQIQRAMDIGSGGVQVPQIETRDDAEAVVSRAKYTPLGARGLSYYTRAAAYNTTDKAGVLDRLNDEQLVIIHVEGVRGIENLDEIVRVPGIDVVFLGPYDLSQSLGIPGQVDSPRVTGLMADACRRIRSAGKVVGTFADDATAGRRWAEAGVQYVAIGVDVHLYFRACREIVSEMREAPTVPTA
jgi:4-hydroxy-2-oxoheptanedioate aldolase